MRAGRLTPTFHIVGRIWSHGVGQGLLFVAKHGDVWFAAIVEGVVWVVVVVVVAGAVFAAAAAVVVGAGVFVVIVVVVVVAGVVVVVVVAAAAAVVGGQWRLGYTIDYDDERNHSGYTCRSSGYMAHYKCFGIGRWYSHLRLNEQRAQGARVQYCKKVCSFVGWVVVVVVVVFAGAVVSYHGVGQVQRHLVVWVPGTGRSGVYPRPTTSGQWGRLWGWPYHRVMTQFRNDSMI